jgi:peptidoglycan L-alanyl-D-glutamate endopeptidase CwlK
MAFTLSQRSLGRLDGVKNELHSVVTTAIGLTDVDFGVICGLRTEQEQADIVARGASQTMASKHLTGDAVDVMAYIQTDGKSRASWELNLYDDIADAFKEASVREGVGIRWGGAWHIDDFRDWEGTAEEAMNAYIDLRRSQNRRPFLDCVHFELVST